MEKTGKIAYSQKLKTYLGDAIYYGYMLKDTKCFLTHMRIISKIDIATKHKRIFAISTEIGAECPQVTKKRLIVYYQKKFFLCVESGFLEEFLIQYNKKNTTEILELSLDLEDVSFLLPYLIKTCELIKYGKKGEYTIKLKFEDGKKYYLFEIEEKVLDRIVTYCNTQGSL